MNGHIHAKPSVALIINNVIMAGLCLLAVIDLIQWGQNYSFVPFLYLYAFLIFLTALQAHGTFFASELSSAIVSLIFAAIAVLGCIAVFFASLDMLMERNAHFDQAFLVAVIIAGYAMFCSVVNLQRNTVVARPPPAGICVVCGYDLRATPQRCPECGHVPAKGRKESR